MKTINGLLIPDWIRVASVLANYFQKKEHVWTSARLAKELDISYAHVHEIVAQLHKKRYITRKKAGRQSILELTSAGRYLADASYALLQCLR